ncbi:MAG: hypothetical protein GXO02_00530 [Epsilonproteobacteria bacterium]|nr:hypothetical protein [Campylobacterota bacterium]
MKKLAILGGMVLLGSFAIAGGNIEPVQPVTEPAPALGVVGAILAVFLSAFLGSKK